MRNKVQHTHIFSGWFTKHPQLGNILGSIYIGISNIATVWTTKVLAVSITNRFTHIADFGSIFRVDHNKGNTCKPGLIFKKGTKLSKSPRSVNIHHIFEKVKQNLSRKDRQFLRQMNQAVSLPNFL